MEMLDISGSECTRRGLSNVTRLLQTTQLNTISFGNNNGIFDDEISTRLFAVGLGANRYVKQLYISDCHLDDEGIRLILPRLLLATRRWK